MLKFYKTIVRAILLYRSEIWILTSRQLRRTETAEMKLTRPLRGSTLYDYKQNEDICQELNIFAITEIIKVYQSNWHEQVSWIPNQIEKPYSKS